MSTSIDIYEALRGAVGDEAARIVAEAIPERDQLATRSDLLATRADLKGDIAELKAEMRGWMLTFFVPLWIGVYGTLAAVIVSILAD